MESEENGCNELLNSVKHRGELKSFETTLNKFCGFVKYIFAKNPLSSFWRVPQLTLVYCWTIILNMIRILRGWVRVPKSVNFLDGKSQCAKTFATKNAYIIFATKGVRKLFSRQKKSVHKSFLWQKNVCKSILRQKSVRTWFSRQKKCAYIIFTTKKYVKFQFHVQVKIIYAVFVTSLPFCGDITILA